MSEEKKNDPKQVVVTTQQYRQIDFLRIFRLCKDLGLFNRKRKMPTEYVLENQENNDKNGRSACRRLLRALIVHIFPSNYTIKSNFNNYFVEFPIDVRNALSYINANSYNIERSSNLEHREALTGFRLIATNLNDFVYPRIPYSIKIHFSPEQRRRYGYVRNTGNGREDYIWKPPENFYQCAKTCLEYKENLEKYIELIMKIAIEHRKDVEEVAAARYRKKVEEADKILQTARSSGPESMTILANAVAQSAQTGPRNTQESFNRALQDMLNRRRNDEI